MQVQVVGFADLPELDVNGLYINRADMIQDFRTKFQQIAPAAVVQAVQEKLLDFSTIPWTRATRIEVRFPTNVNPDGPLRVASDHVIALYNLRPVRIGKFEQEEEIRS